MYLHFQYDREKFMQIYPRRSDVESTFFMLKRKFQNRLFSRKEVAQTNEALAKVLCHNLVVLIKESGNADFSWILANLHTNYPPCTLREEFRCKAERCS